MIMGLGKNEWSIIVFLAGMSSFVLLHKEHYVKLYIIKFIFGLLVGSLISWQLDPDNFMGGFNIIFRFTIGQETFFNLFTKMAYFKFFVFWFWREIILVSVTFFYGIKIIRKIETQEDKCLFLFTLLFLFLYISLLLIASWFGDGFPRYFIICIPFLLVYMAILMKEEIKLSYARKLIFIYVIIFSLNLGQHFFSKSGFRSAFMKKKSFICSEYLKKQGIDDSCVYIVPGGVGWYTPTLNFFHNDANKKNMKHKKPLCSFSCDDIPDSF